MTTEELIKNYDKYRKSIFDSLYEIFASEKIKKIIKKEIGFPAIIGNESSEPFIYYDAEGKSSKISWRNKALEENNETKSFIINDMAFTAISGVKIVVNPRHLGKYPVIKIKKELIEKIDAAQSMLGLKLGVFFEVELCALYVAIESISTKIDLNYMCKIIIKIADDKVRSLA